VGDIRVELQERLAEFQRQNKLVEAQRLEQRTMLDLEMIEEMGYCNGIENYSRHLDGRAPGTPPSTLLDYFPEDFILFIDESHIAVSQVAGMFNGDRSRKSTLVDFGFRLPSALDNRPLSFEEFQARIGQTIYVSATPGEYEVRQSQGVVAEQIIRPTGLVDPELLIRPVKGQVDDLLGRCKERIARGERVLVTTLTKRMAEDLTEYFNKMGVAARYLHSDVDTLERVAILQALRKGDFDVLVGINLLREGLDLPEVSLVAILDADKEGFLRSTRSLIQTFGRAARNVAGLVVLYADTITPSMRAAMDETERRRARQIAHNQAHGIVPQSVRKEAENVLDAIHAQARQREQQEGGKPRRGRGKGQAPAPEADQATPAALAAEEAALYGADPKRAAKEIKTLERQMREAARDLEFERAAQLRDRIKRLRELLTEADTSVHS